jgi:hypothetical protein
MKVGCRTGVLRHRELMDGILFWGEKNILIESDFSASTNSELSFEASFGFKPFVCLKHKPNV